MMQRCSFNDVLTKIGKDESDQSWIKVLTEFSSVHGIQSSSSLIYDGKEKVLQLVKQKLNTTIDLNLKVHKCPLTWELTCKSNNNKQLVQLFKDLLCNIYILIIFIFLILYFQCRHCYVIVCAFLLEIKPILNQ